MSREIRRVPVDFDWPLDKVWSGYLTPDKFQETSCMDCYKRGSTPAMQWIERMALMLEQVVADVDANAAGKRMHPWLAGDKYPPTYTEYDVEKRVYLRHEVIRPSEDIIEFAAALVKDDPIEHYRTVQRGPLAQNSYAFTAAFLRMAGLPEKWGSCQTCNGHGSLEAYEGQRAEAESWQPTPPPTGEGWQCWETTSEGSPISPVFPERDGLIEWLMSPAYNRGLSRSLTREQAEAFVDAGSSMASFVVMGSNLIPGDAAVHELGLADQGGAS